MRDVIFVSHANPEDNSFSRWLSLQLAKEGFPVWCDVTRLLGGEDFWSDIEETIRQRAAKFIYVLSRHSNHKAGPLQELHVAQAVARTHGLKDFVIPARMDDMPYSETNIQLSRLNAIDFTSSWATGLRSLIEKLLVDGVEKDTRFSPESVANWWKTSREFDSKVTNVLDEYLSNWFPIRRLPDHIYVHSIDRLPFGVDGLQFPARIIGRTLVSFASYDDTEALSHGARVISSRRVPLNEFLGGLQLLIPVREREAHNIVVGLLREAWERFTESAQMSKHSLSNNRVAVYLKDGQVHNNRVAIPSKYSGSRTRGIVGYRSRRNNEGTVVSLRYWHFAFEARPMLEPLLGYRLIPHLLFSDDGTTIWSDSSRQHRAQRAESRNWWNAEWRDRTLGLVQWLADGQDNVTIRLGPDAIVEMETHPAIFNSPVSYADPDARQSIELFEDDFDEPETQEDNF